MNNQIVTSPSSGIWKKICTLKGGTGKEWTPVFELYGGPCRIKYKYKSNCNTDPYAISSFWIYVLEEGADPDDAIHDCYVDAEKEEGELVIEKPAGKYYLYVDAEGLWSITVEEFLKKEERFATQRAKTFSVADELIKLKKLVDDGVITQEEFDKQKKKLLKTN